MCKNSYKGGLFVCYEHGPDNSYMYKGDYLFVNDMIQVMVEG